MPTEKLGLSQSAPQLSHSERIGSVVLLLCILVSGIVGSWRVGRRLVRLDSDKVMLGFTIDEEGRIEREFNRLERSCGYQEGELRILNDALQTKVPADAFIWVHSGPERAKRKAIFRLGLLAFPRQFDELPDEALGSIDPHRIGSDVFVLDLEPLDARVFETWFDRIAESPSWRIWQGKGRAR